MITKNYGVAAKANVSVHSLLLFLHIVFWELIIFNLIFSVVCHIILPYYSVLVIKTSGLQLIFFFTLIPH